MILAAVPSLCFAQSYRFTNQFGGTTGYAQPQLDGGYRFTNQFGGTAGYAQPQLGGGYRFTDQFGGTVGYLRRGF